MSNFNDSWRAGGTGHGSYILQSRATGQIPLIVKGFLGQTANILEIQNSAGTVLFSVDPTGDLTITGSTSIVIDEAVTGALTVGGLATFNGNVILGDTSGDTITVTGTPTFATASTFNKPITLGGSTALTAESHQIGRNDNQHNQYNVPLTQQHIFSTGGVATMTIASTQVAINSALVVGGKLTANGGSTLMGQVSFADGTAALPSITFSSDLDTGIYRSASNTIDFTLGGARDFAFTANDFQVLAGSQISLADDAPAVLGGVTSILHETADANANALLFAMPTGGGTDVPVAIFGDATALNLDLGLFNGITDPTIAVLSDDATKALRISHNGTDGVITTSAGALVVNATALLPDANDAYALGVSGTAFSDVFLASGATIDFSASDVILTHSANTLTMTGGNLVLTQPIVDASTPTAFTITGGAHTAITTTAEAIGFNMNFSAIKTWANGNVATQREVVIQAPTYAFTSAPNSTIATASTLTITGAPIAGDNCTITSARALTVTGGITVLGGQVTISGNTFPQAVFLPENTGLFFDTGGLQGIKASTGQTNDSIIIGVDGTANGRNVIIAELGDWDFDFAHTNPTNPTFYVHSAEQSTTQWVSLAHNQTDAVLATGAGGIQFTQPAGTTGLTGFTFNIGAHTGITAATERIGIDVGAVTKTWAVGAGPLATQREVVIQAPTYVGNVAGALTITDAATLDVTGAPIVGANLTISNGHAIRAGGRITINQASAVPALDANYTATTYVSGEGFVNLARSGALTGVAAEFIIDSVIAPAFTLTEPGAGTITYIGKSIDFTSLAVTAGVGTSVVEGMRIEMSGDADIGTERALHVVTGQSLFEDVILVGATAALADFTGASIIVSQADTGETSASNFAIVGESEGGASPTTGNGVFGAGRTTSSGNVFGVRGSATVTLTGDTGGAYGVRGTSSSTHAGGNNYGGDFSASNGLINYAVRAIGATKGTGEGFGVSAVAQVSATGDTATAYGVSGVAISTHAGGNNIGIYGEASAGALNYSFYGAAGTLYNIGTSQLIGTATIGGSGVDQYSHIKSLQETAPTTTLTGTTLNDGAGSGAAIAVTAGSTDLAGSFTVTAGNGTPTAGIAGQIVFDTAYGTAPKSVIVTSKDLDGVNNQIYVATVGTGSFEVSFGTALATSEVVEFYYLIIE